MTEPRKRGRGGGIALGFAASSLASLGLAFVYLAGGQVQLEGILLGVALGGLGVGLIGWAADLMPEGPYVEEREALSKPSDRAEAADALVGGELAIERRGFLGRMLGVALACLGVAAVFPIRSLGSKPGTSLLHTQWEAGARLVTLDAAPVRPERLDVGGVLTVFPEGQVGSADSQALLIRLEEGAYEPRPGRESWAPEGLVGFSKICTHAGSAVSAYRTPLFEPTAPSPALVSPCHYSTFDPATGGDVVFGPAGRPLPQLPLMIDASGELRAAGSFSGRVGPAWSGVREGET